MRTIFILLFSLIFINSSYAFTVTNNSQDYKIVIKAKADQWWFTHKYALYPNENMTMEEKMDADSKAYFEITVYGADTNDVIERGWKLHLPAFCNLRIEQDHGHAMIYVDDQSIV